MGAAGLHHDIGTLSLGRGYDHPKVRAGLAARGPAHLGIQRRGTKAPPGTWGRLTLGFTGSSRPPTPGGPATASSDATPTASLPTAMPPCA